MTRPVRPTTHHLRATLLLAAIAPWCVTACANGNAATTAEPAEHQRDFIQLDPKSPRLSFVKVEVVAESRKAATVDLTGRVAFDEDHTQRVASPIDGRATSILVTLGQKVRAGAPLVEIASPRVGEIQAEAQKAEQDLGLAEKSVDRAHKLSENGAISDKELAQVEAEHRKAKADVGRTAAELRSLGISPGDPTVKAVLRAQIAGTIVERNVLLGQEIRGDAAVPLLTVTELGTVWVLADVYEQDLALVQPGAPVKVTVAAYPGEIFAGAVGHVGDVVDPVSRTVKIRCLVPNPAGRLKPEMFAKVEVDDTSGRKVMTIPSQAVLTDSEHTRVLVASDGNVFRARVVEVGPEADGRVRVLGGLNPGEKIVTEGAIFLKKEMDRD
jgi:cobalt-zinc-cadmium efflux system membrane fusion protein